MIYMSHNIIKIIQEIFIIILKDIINIKIDDKNRR
jgi:hypothetical protein